MYEVAPLIEMAENSSDVNKDLNLKAKARTKDQTLKAKDRTKDLSFKAKAKDCSSREGHNLTVRNKHNTSDVNSK